MILPNDNNIVCTCSACKAIGNTEEDAAPAVFHLLNKLAQANKRSTFFTAAYNTVKEVPEFNAEQNRNGSSNFTHVIEYTVTN